MMWNFLAGVLLTPASIVLYDGSPGHPDLGVLWDLAEQARGDLLRHERGLHRLVHEGGRRAGAGPRPERAAQRRLDRLAAVARGLSLGLRRARRGHLAVLDQRRHRRLHGVRRRRARCCPSTRASCRPARSAPTSTPSTRTGNAVVGEVGELVHHRADALDAGLLLERPRRRAAARELLRDVPGRLAPRRLDRDHRRAAPRSSTAARDSTINRGGIRMGTSEIYRAVLALDDDRRRAVVESTVPARRAGEEDSWMPLFVVLRDGAALDDDLTRAIARRVREDCSPRHVPERGLRDRRGPAHAVGQGARGPGQADPDGHAARAGGAAATRCRTPPRSTGSSSWPGLTLSARSQMPSERSLGSWP